MLSAVTDYCLQHLNCFQCCLGAHVVHLFADFSQACASEIREASSGPCLPMHVHVPLYQRLKLTMHCFFCVSGCHLLHACEHARHACMLCQCMAACPEALPLNAPCNCRIMATLPALRLTLQLWHALGCMVLLNVQCIHSIEAAALQRLLAIVFGHPP